MGTRHPRALCEIQHPAGHHCGVSGRIFDRRAGAGEFWHRTDARTDILEFSPGVCIHPIENLDIYHQIFMFWMKERYRLPAVERFIEYMKQQARQDGLQAERETDSKNVLKIYLKDIVNF